MSDARFVPENEKLVSENKLIQKSQMESELIPEKKEQRIRIEKVKPSELIGHNIRYSGIRSGLYFYEEMKLSFKQNAQKEILDLDDSLAADAKTAAIAAIHQKYKLKFQDHYHQQVFVLLNGSYDKKIGLGKNALDAQGDTPLLSAVKNFNYPAYVWVTEHQDNQCDWDAKDMAGMTALDYMFSKTFASVENAAQQRVRHKMFLRVLKGRGSKQREIDSKNAAENGDFTYLYALNELQKQGLIERSSYYVVQQDKQFQVTLPTNIKNLYNFLIHAVNQSNLEAVKLILGPENHSLPWDALPVHQENLLKIAVKNGDIKIYDLLVKIKYFANNRGGIIRAADEAVTAGKLTPGQAYLIQIDGNVIFGENASYILLQSENEDLIKQLKREHLINAQLSGAPLYEYIAKNDHFRAAQIFVNLQVPLDESSLFWGTTSPILDMAARWGSINVFKILLLGGATYHNKTIHDKNIPTEALLPERLRISAYLDVIRELDRDRINEALIACRGVDVKDADDLIKLIKVRFKNRYAGIIQERFDEAVEYRNLKSASIDKEEKQSSSMFVPFAAPVAVSASASSSSHSSNEGLSKLAQVIKETGYATEVFTKFGDDAEEYLKQVYLQLDRAVYVAELIDKKEVDKERQKSLVMAVKYLNYPAFVWLTTHPSKDINYDARDDNKLSAMDYLIEFVSLEDPYVQAIRRKMFSVLLPKVTSYQMENDRKAALSCDYDYFNQLRILQAQGKIAYYSQRLKFNQFNYDILRTMPGNLYSCHYLSTHTDNLILLLISAVGKKNPQAIQFIFDHGFNHIHKNVEMACFSSKSIHWGEFPELKAANLPARAVMEGDMDIYNLIINHLPLHGVAQAIPASSSEERRRGIQSHCIDVIKADNLSAADIGHLVLSCQHADLLEKISVESLQTASAEGLSLYEIAAKRNLKDKVEFLIAKKVSFSKEKSQGYFAKSITICPALDIAAFEGSIDIFKVLLAEGAIYTAETAKQYSAGIAHRNVSFKSQDGERIRDYLKVIENLDNSLIDRGVQVAQSIHVEDKADLFDLINKRYNNRYRVNFQFVLSAEASVSSMSASSVQSANKDSLVVSSLDAASAMPPSHLELEPSGRGHKRSISFEERRAKFEIIQKQYSSARMLNTFSMAADSSASSSDARVAASSADNFGFYDDPADRDFHVPVEDYEAGISRSEYDLASEMAHGYVTASSIPANQGGGKFFNLDSRRRARLFAENNHARVPLTPVSETDETASLGSGLSAMTQKGSG